MLPVAVGGLVQIHEVHVDLFVRNRLIILRGQVTPGLLQQIKAGEPHFGRGEGVAPGDDPGALLAVIGLFHDTGDFIARLGGHLVDKRKRQGQAQLLCHLPGAGLDGFQNLGPVEKLTAYHKPEFIVFHTVPPCYLMTFSALRSMVSATNTRKMMPLMSCCVWVS